MRQARCPFPLSSFYVLFIFFLLSESLCIVLCGQLCTLCKSANLIFESDANVCYSNLVYGTFSCTRLIFIPRFMAKCFYFYFYLFHFFLLNLFNPCMDLPHQLQSKPQVFLLLLVFFGFKSCLAGFYTDQFLFGPVHYSVRYLVITENNIMLVFKLLSFN